MFPFSQALQYLSDNFTDISLFKESSTVLDTTVVNLTYCNELASIMVFGPPCILRNFYELLG